jgi:hypothetical protein
LENPSSNLELQQGGKEKKKKRKKAPKGETNAFFKFLVGEM